MKEFVALTIVFLVLVIGISESFGQEPVFDFGEYYSEGNLWLEITHSVQHPPPWKVWKNTFHNELPDTLVNSSSEFELAHEFFKQYDVELLDLIHSGKNAQMCEAIGCLNGTYHLLFSEVDVLELKKIKYGFFKFADWGIVESIVTGERSKEAHWEAKHLFLSTEGQFELQMDLFYDSEYPSLAGYFCYECKIKDVREEVDLTFVDSIVVLQNSFFRQIIPITTENISDEHAKVRFSSILEIPPKSLHGYMVELGLGWVRIFEDANGEKFYQWMRSETLKDFTMNKINSANGTFFVYYPFPEIKHKHNDSSLYGFDYTKWINDKLYVESPLKQTQKGLMGNEIQCKSSLKLIFKFNGSPACVKPESIPKLIERGWTKTKNPEQFDMKNNKTWGIGENLHVGDYFSYNLCHVSYKECSEITINLWYEEKIDEKWLVQVSVYDGDHVVRGEFEYENYKILTNSESEEIIQYLDVFSNSVLAMSRFATVNEGEGLAGPKAFNEDSWGKYGKIGGEKVSPTEIEYITIPAGTFESHLITFSPFNKINKIWIVDEIPFPVKAEVWSEIFEIPIQEYKFELRQVANTLEDPLVPVISTDHISN